MLLSQFGIIIKQFLTIVKTLEPFQRKHRGFCFVWFLCDNVFSLVRVLRVMFALEF